MDLEGLFTRGDGRRRIVSVLLLSVLVTLIVAVAGLSVLGPSDIESALPKVSFAFDYEERSPEDTDCGTALGTDGVLIVSHDGGIEIPPDRLELGDDEGNRVTVGGDCGVATVLSAGDSFSAAIDSDDTVHVVLLSEDGGDSEIVGNFTGPAAESTNHPYSSRVRLGI